MYKISWCDDLGEPELGVILDRQWIESNYSDIKEWLDHHNSIMYDKLLIFVPEEEKTEFSLIWL